MASSFEWRDVLRAKRRNYFVCAAFFLCGLLFHCLVTRTFPVRLVLTELVWSVSLFMLGMSVGTGWVASRWASLIATSICLVATTMLVHQSGGPTSPYFQMFTALPFLLAMFSPETLVPTLLGSGATLGAVVLVDLLAQVPPERVALQVVDFVMLVALALVGMRTYRRMVDAQRTTDQQRLEVMEQLADSERRRARSERERAEVERLVLVGQLAAGVAHEVNNPLAYVKSNLGFLEREVRNPDPLMDRDELRLVLAETQQGVLRIQQIVTDLRSFSRAGSQSEEEQGQLESALLEATRLASVRLRERGHVLLALDPGLPMVRLGQRHLVQVLLNLLLNAADAVEAADPTCMAHISVRAWRVEALVRVEVDDNGPGIAPEVLQRLFEPFYTTKPPGQGTGLGLALCREFISRVGGTIHAENRPGGGARFVIQLPVIPALT